MNIPRQRSETEVVERIRALSRDRQDFFGFQREVLCAHLSGPALAEFTDLTPEEIEKWEPQPLHVESILVDLADYMEFAWGKVIDHRGISANRSVDKISTWVWLMGLDDLLAAVEEADYPQYGAPKLALVCFALQLPVPIDEGTQRMICGERCVPDCGEGCG